MICHRQKAAIEGTRCFVIVKTLLSSALTGSSRHLHRHKRHTIRSSCDTTMSYVSTRRRSNESKRDRLSISIPRPRISPLCITSWSRAWIFGRMPSSGMVCRGGGNHVSIFLGLPPGLRLKSWTGIHPGNYFRMHPTTLSGR